MKSEQNFQNIQDYKEIMKVINLYCSGWQRQPEKFREAFDKDAWIFFTESNGQLHKYLLTDCFEGWAQTNWLIEAEVISMNQCGDIASVTFKFSNKSNPAASFVDVHNLLKVNGRWKITNKTATHISRGGKGDAKCE